MSVSKKTVLVTGADGFIGSHVAEALVRLGVETRAFVYYNAFSSWGWLDAVPSGIKDGLEVVSGDIRDPHGVKKAMAGCDTVLHLAALIGIPYSYHSPDSYVDTNVKGTLNVLQAARELAVSKIVHTSTSEVYGTAQSVPIREDHPLQAQSPYAATKIAADQLALSFYRSFRLPVCVLRPFNVFGPRQSARAVIPAVITQIAGGQSEIDLGSLHPTRDFTFVSDAVEAFVAAVESDRGIGEVIHLGTGSEFSIGEVVTFVAELMHAGIRVRTDPERVRPKESEVERLVADNAKAARLLGWSPSYAGAEGFKRGLGETIRWFSDPGNLAKYKTNLCAV